MASVFLQLKQLYDDRAELFFDKVRAAPAISYVNIYVSLGEFATYYLAKVMIPNVSDGQASNPQVNFNLTLEEVQGADSSLASVSYSGTMLFVKATTVDVEGTESDLAAATAKSLGTVGVRRSMTQDNPAKAAYLAGLSQAAKGWGPVAMSSLGAIHVSQIPFYEDEFVIERTFSGSNIATETIYLKNDPEGARALLITYSSYTGAIAGKVEYSFTTRPALTP